MDQRPNIEPCVPCPGTACQEERSLTSADVDTPPAPVEYPPPSWGHPLLPRVAEAHMPVPAPTLLSEGTHRKIQKAPSGRRSPLFQMDDAFSQHRVQGDRKG